MDYQPKSFWERPEGLTGMIVLAAALVGGGYFLFSILPALLALTSNLLYLSVLLVLLASLVFVALDPAFRRFLFYLYKSAMRQLTSIFVQVDPIGILKTYIESLQNNLRKMNLQINQLRGQMHQLKEVIFNNEKEIAGSLELASKARAQNAEAAMILKSRKAGRLQDSNVRLEDLYKKMELLYKVLCKMHENSAILCEDITDQVKVKEIEQKAIATSAGAMRSAMSILSGNPDQKALFDQALEAMADDVSQKMGEMERFMDVSNNFMKSIDLQNGVFEEEGMAMLEKWEKEGVSLILGKEKESILQTELPLTPAAKAEPLPNSDYDHFFK